jgi:hypothetical protein
MRMVHTAKAPQGRYRPCKDCPWRTDAPVGVWPRERFLSLAATCRGDHFSAFACHGSDRLVCAGWAAVEGEESPGFRFQVILGYDPRRLTTGGIPLYDSFDAMLAANGITQAPDGRLRPEERELDAQALVERVFFRGRR